MHLLLLVLSVSVLLVFAKESIDSDHVFRLTSLHENYESNCQGLLLLLKKKKGLIATIDRTRMHIKAGSEDDEDKQERLKILELFRRELKAAEFTLLIALKDMDRTVNSDYKLLDNIKNTCKQRLDDLRDISAQAEENYAAILSLEKDIDSKHSNVSVVNAGRFLNDILVTLSHAVDELEKELKENTFERLLNVKGAQLETVVKLITHDYDNTKEIRSDDSEAIPVLVDSLNNYFVLSRPGDRTVSQEDQALLRDLITIFLLCFVLGAFFAHTGVPSHLAYMIAGTVLGPSGYNVVTSVVQVETVGELGVILVLFVVGLDLSPDNLRKVWRVSVYGANLMMLVSIVLGMSSSAVFEIHPLHGLFVAACLALSSTPLVARFLESTSDAEYADSLMGILVVQDIQLGALIAMMPLLCLQSYNSKALDELLKGGFILCSTLLFLMLMCRLMSLLVIDRLFRLLNSFLNKKESILIGAIATCFFFSWISNLLGLSMELGCFLAGLAISTRGQSLAKDVRKLVEPVRNFFMCYFFSSAGFHVFPTFLLSEWRMLVSVTLLVVGGKLLLAVLVVGLFQGYRRSHTWIIATGLAQVSEFSLVLGSRARRLRIVTREVYLVILSVSILSLLLAPLLWKVAHKGLSFNLLTSRWYSKHSKPKPRTLPS